MATPTSMHAFLRPPPLLSGYASAASPKAAEVPSLDQADTPLSPPTLTQLMPRAAQVRGIRELQAPRFEAFFDDAAVVSPGVSPVRVRRHRSRIEPPPADVAPDVMHGSPDSSPASMEDMVLSPMNLRRPSRQVAPQLPIPERSVAQHEPPEPFQAVRRISSGSALSLLFDTSEVLDRPKLDRTSKDVPVRASKDAPRTPVCRFSKDLCIEAPTTPTAHPATPKGLAPSTPTSAQTMMRGSCTPKTKTPTKFGTPRYSVFSGLDTPPARTCTRKMRCPTAPSVRREAMELEDDIAMALATGSLPELVTTLSRRHTCACSHPVHEAVRRRHVGALRMLLAHGFKADELCGGYGERLTPLQVCLGAGADGDVFCTMTVEQQVQMVEALLDHGANPNVHIPRPWGLQGTALHVACHQVNVWLVQVLLARGANPNACDSVGQTALHTAATFANGHPNGREITELLVASGASPLATCHRELTARQYSLDHSVQRTLARAERWWRCRMLAWVRSRSVTENVVRWLPEDALRLVADML